ncbi:MAG: c-type cytochrome [Anditalea sp.]
MCTNFCRAPDGNLAGKTRRAAYKASGGGGTACKGDVGEGRKIFFGRSACYTCHSVGPDGGEFGPDLTNIGEIRSRHDILEAIMYPNASFAREYETYQVETKTNTYTGVIAEQLSDAIILTIGPGPGIRIPRTDIVSIEPDHVSMMPPGLDQQLSVAEMADLIAFLEALPYDIDRLIEARERE